MAEGGAADGEHISLNLAARYAEHWGVWEGIRELVQNWHDGHLETAPANADVAYADHGGALHVATVAHGEGSIPPLGWLAHDPATNRLVMANRGIEISRQALLLGFSKKAKHRQAVGHFGEGMKVGALALLRHGCAVSMDTGSERWNFELVHDKTYDMQVLGVHAVPRAAAVEAAEAEGRGFAFSGCEGGPALTVGPADSVCVVEGITAAEWKAIVPKFLFLTDHDVADDEAVPTPQGTLLLAKRHRGALFVKGIWIAQYEDMVAGVDFSSLQLDRDRVASLRREDVEHQVASMWVRAASANQTVLAKFFAMAQEASADAAIDMRHAAFYADAEVAALLADAWMSQFGDMLPVSASDQPGTLSRLRDEFEKETCLVSHTLASILRKDDRFQTLDQTLAALVDDKAAGADGAGGAASEAVALASLTEESLDLIAYAGSLVAAAVPHFDLVTTIDLVNAPPSTSGGGSSGGGGGGGGFDLVGFTDPHTPAVCLKDERVVVPVSYLEYDGQHHEACPSSDQPWRHRWREVRLASAVIDALSPTMEVDLGQRGAQAQATLHQRLAASLAAQACGMCPVGCPKWYEAGDAAESGTATLTATPMAMGVFVARERALQESIDACRLKQISTETEHLSKLKTMQCEVERADTLAMQFEVERMNMQARAKKEAEALVAAKVADAEARAVKAEREKMNAERELEYQRELNAGIEQKLVSISKATERRVEASLKRQTALKASLTAALKLALEKEQRGAEGAEGAEGGGAAADGPASTSDGEVASMIKETLQQLGVVLDEGEGKQRAFCCVCMDAPVEVVLMPCRHLSMCAECGGSVSRCPLCRVQIEERLKIYGAT